MQAAPFRLNEDGPVALPVWVAWKPMVTDAPPGWLRVPARDLFAAVYDGLAPAAQDRVRAVAARFADAPSLDIRAHRGRAGCRSAP